MQVPFVSVWQIIGVVSERRELKSQKSDWRGYVVKLAGLGSTTEVQVTPEVFGGLVEGSLVEAKGHFQQQGDKLRLVADKVAPYQEKKVS